MYCPKCGNANPDDAVVCNFCSAVMSDPGTEQPVHVDGGVSQKSKVVAGVLGILLGAWGAHNFYLGFTTKAIIQLVISLVGLFLFGSGTFIVWIWGLVEGILYLTGNKKVDAKGNLLN